MAPCEVRKLENRDRTQFFVWLIDDLRFVSLSVLKKSLEGKKKKKNADFFAVLHIAPLERSYSFKSEFEIL